MSGEPFSFAVSIARIAAGGKRFRVKPNEEERRAIAKTLAIVEVAKLAADIDVRPAGAEAYKVSGTLHASVVQTDVVTLEPVRQDVSEAVDVTLLPEESGSPAKNRMTRHQTAPDSPEDRDVYSGGRIDLGAIVVEHLALGLDPYPRSPGVEFSGHIESDSAAEASPFATLAKLKRDRE